MKPAYASQCPECGGGYEVYMRNGDPQIKERHTRTCSKRATVDELRRLCKGLPAQHPLRFQLAEEERLQVEARQRELAAAKARNEALKEAGLLTTYAWTPDADLLEVGHIIIEPQMCTGRGGRRVSAAEPTPGARCVWP